jgi:hypothetical protein
MKSSPNYRLASFSALPSAIKQACCRAQTKKARLAGELFILK